MSKKSEELSKYLRICNSHNYCSTGEGRIFIDYLTQDLGRGGHSAAWLVTGVREAVDPDAHWTDHGRKSFVMINWGNQYNLPEGASLKDLRAAALKAAKNWTDKKYGKLNWVKDALGGWQDKKVIDTVDAKLKAAKEADNG